MKKLLLLIFALLLVGSVSAWEWDNVGEYDETTNCYTIINALGFGDTIAKICLLSPYNYHVGTAGEEKLVAWYYLENYQEYDGNDVFGEIETYDLNNDGAPLHKNFKFKQKHIDEDNYYIRTLYHEVCEEDPLNHSQVCHTEVAGYEQVFIPEWRAFNQNHPLGSGNITLGLFTEVEEREHIEWIANIYGVRLEEWAAWSAALDVDIWAYYKFDTATQLNDSVGHFNATSNRTDIRAGGIINENFNFSSSNWVNLTADIGATAQTYANFSINLWVNVSEFEGFPKIVDRYEAGGGATGQFRIQLDGTQAKFLVHTIDGTAEAVAAFSANATHYQMITGVYNRTDIAVWINGTLYGKIALTGAMTATRDGMILGMDSLLRKNQYNGTIDELGIWNRSLTPTEISDLWNDGKGLAFRSGIPSGSVTVTLNSPADSSGVNEAYILFNATITATHSNITNATIFVYNSTDGIAYNITNTTLSGNNTANTTLFNLSFGLGSYDWNVYGCVINHSGWAICDWGNNNYSFSYQEFEILAMSYENLTYELAQNTFTINVSYDSAVWNSVSAKLRYNNTLYISTRLGSGEYYNFTNTIFSPPTDESVNKTFHWEFELISGSLVLNINSSSGNQSLSNISIDDCSENPEALLNLTVRDEETQNILIGNVDNTTIEIDLILSTLDGTQTIQYSNNFTEYNSVQICVPLGFTGNNTLRVDTLIGYDADDHVHEFYNIQNATLSGTNFPQYIDLYDLAMADSQEFLVTFKGDNLLPVADALITVTRKYVADGVFRTVEAPLTDADGHTLIHLVLSEIIYRFQVSKHGEILYISDEYTAFCENVATGECEINLNVFTTGTSPEDFTTKNNLSYYFEYDDATRTISLIFSVVGGATATIGLNGTLFDNYGNNTICASTLTSSAGTMDCIVPASYGNVTVRMDLFKDNDFTDSAFFKIGEKVIDIFKENGYIFALFLYITLPLMFLPTPIGIIIGIVLGLIFASLLLLYEGGSLVGVTSIIIWIIIAGGILIWKITRKENGT